MTYGPPEDPEPTTRPASPPTSASKWEQPSVTSSTPYTPDGMAPELARLLEQLNTPPQKPEVNTGKRWMNVASDALLNASSIMAGGGPIGYPSTDRFDAMGQRDAENYDAAVSKQGDEKRGLIGAEVGRRNAEATRIAAERRKAIADAEDEQRKAQLKDREDVVREYSGMLGWKDPNLSKFIPSDFDITKATMKDVLDIKRRYVESIAPDLGVDKETAATLALYHTLQQQEPGLMEDKNPSTTISNGKLSITANRPEQSQMPAGKVPTVSGLTPDQLAKHSLKLGENVADWPLSKITEALARMGTERRNWVKFSPAEAKEFATYDELVQVSEELYDEIKNTGIGGADTFGFATTQEAADFRAKALNARDVLERSRTGATTNPRDTTTYDTLYAKLGNFTRNNMAALKETSAFISDISRRRLGYKMVPESQRRYIRLLNSGVDIDSPDATETDDGVEVPPGYIER